MNVLTLLEMAATGMPGRVGIGRLQPADAALVGLTYRALLDRARCGAGVLVERGAEELVYVGVNADDFAVALFAAAWAGIPLVPLNYRLSRDALGRLLAHHPNALGHLRPAAADDSPRRYRGAVEGGVCRAVRRSVAVVGRSRSSRGAAVHQRDHVRAKSGRAAPPPPDVLLAGQHRLRCGRRTEAVIVSVPPYHIAGVSNLLSNICAGRRVVYLETFTAQGWLDCVRDRSHHPRPARSHHARQDHRTS